MEANSCAGLAETGTSRLLPAKVHAAGAVELHKRSSKLSQLLLPSRSCSGEGLHALLANSWPGNLTRLRLTVWNIKKISRPERPETTERPVAKQNRQVRSSQGSR